MQFTLQERRDSISGPSPTPAWKISSIILGCLALLLAAAIFTFHQIEIGSVLLLIVLLTFSSMAFLHARFLYLARKQFRITSGELETRELEFQSLFENALDSILILDGHGTCLNANPSALRLLGVSRERLLGQPIATFYRNQHAFESFWEPLLAQRHDRGQLEIVRTDGAELFLDFTARMNFRPDRHLMVLRDISSRRKAEEAKAESLALAKSAWQEADALRKATLALTQDLRMNSVLDTLLHILSFLVPYETAQVLLLETDSKLFLA